MIGNYLKLAFQNEYILIYKKYYYICENKRVTKSKYEKIKFNGDVGILLNKLLENKFYIMMQREKRLLFAYVTKLTEYLLDRT